MNVPPSEARALSYYDYQALLWNWNDAHKVGDEGDLPDAETTMALLDKINADPRLTGPAKPKEPVK